MKMTLPGVAMLAVVVLALLAFSLWRPAASVQSDAMVRGPSIESGHQRELALEQREARRHAEDVLSAGEVLDHQRDLARRQKLLLTPRCQFWQQQDELRSTPRTRSLSQQYCNP